MNIEKLKENIENIDAENISSEDIASIRQTIEALDNGKIRVAEQVDGDWLVNEWVKKSILHYFTIENLKVISSGDVIYFDKLEPKKNYEDLKIRVVPPGVVRYGAFCEPGVVVMPGFVNIGAYVGSGTMVDTWANSWFMCSNWKKRSFIWWGRNWRSFRTTFCNASNYRGWCFYWF